MQSNEVFTSAGLSPAAGTATGAAAQIVPTLAAKPGRTLYVTGFDITGSGATAASVINATLGGLSADCGTTLNYALAIPIGATVGLTNGGLFVKFDKPLAASGQNTAITLTIPSFGAGNTLASGNLYGFYSNP